MRMYYMLWVDCITGIREKEEKEWKIKSMIAMNFAMMLNLAFFMAILQRNILGYSFYDIDLSFLSEYVSNVVSYVGLYILPCIVINYLLIFYNKKYEIILKKYPYKKGKLFVTYFIASTLIPIISLWTGIIFFK